MLKKIVFSVLFFSVCISLYVSCKKEPAKNVKSINDNIGNYAITIPFSDSLLMFKQLKWIARGIPAIVHNNDTFKTVVENLIVSNNSSYFASNTEIPNSSSMYVNFRNEVSNINYSNFGSNEYDSSFFFEIEYNNCYLNVGIVCPEIDVVNKNLPHLIVPTDPYGKCELPYYGYFINGSNNLDSVYLDDDDLEDYYIWWVVAEEECGKLNKKGTENCGNNLCEPWFGEKAANCVDCNTIPDVAGKNLVVLGVITGTDKKKFSTSHPDKEYQEWHYKGKYEIYLHFSIENTIVKATSMNAQEIPISITDLTSWGNSCDVRRSKMKNNGNIKTNRGVNREVIITNPITLWTDYNKNVDDIYMCVFEYDHLVGILRHYDPNLMTDFSVKSRNHCYTFNNPNIGNTSPVNLPPFGNKSSEIGFIRHDIGGSPSIFKGPVTIGSFTADTLHMSMDGEMKLILGLR